MIVEVKMMLVPAIHFPGTCKEAISLYQRAFGASVISIAYNHDAPPDSGMAVTAQTQDHVMHAELVIEGTRVNMCDVTETAAPDGMFLLNVFFPSENSVTIAFTQLAQDGRILTDLGPQFWTALYGEVVDRFGVHWQLMVEQ